MQLRADVSTGVLEVTSGTVASFARQKNADPARLGFVSVADDEGDAAVRVQVKASVSAEAGSFPCRVTCTADAVFSLGDTLFVEKQQITRRPLAHVRPMDDPVFAAEAMLNAYLVASAEGYGDVAVRLRFVHGRSGECAVYESRFGIAVLSRIFAEMFSRAAPFIAVEGKRQTVGRRALAALRFPYASIREGQRDFMEELYRCIRRRRRLVVSAPTGIGKTMSALYPSLRAVGEGSADRVFYFTAKTVTGNAALDAIRTLGRQAEELRCIRITAKERVCPVRRQNKDVITNCRLCSFCGFFEGVSYEQRRDRALLELLESGNIYDTEQIEKTAEKYHLCRYELSLDLSEYCEAVVCDYGYLFDPRVQFRRYFAEDRGEKYVFLIDEAHNLPDRAREIYSAEISRKSFVRFAETVKTALPDDRPLHDACDVMEAMLDGVDALCAANAEMGDVDGGVRGYVLEKQVPDFIPEAVSRLRAVCDEYIRRDYDNAMPLFGDMRSVLHRMADAILLADERFAFYAECAGGETVCRILCLDPAALLDASLSRSVSAALFSATLSPMEYYADVCGAKDAVRMDLPSPYETDNLCLVTVDTVSTRLSQRKGSATDVAELIAAVTESRPGNYIVYFSSYEYMETVCRRYLRLSPGGSTIMQKRGMSLGERERFLRAFSRAEERGDCLTAFCVLGGIFSEGIDLQGEKLIGSIIVGLGLPGMSSESNILEEYYERTREEGHAYAYTYPAMNKVLQAAGRVIRSEADRGVVVLIDDRYADPAIRSLFPAHWHRMQYTGDAYSLGRILERFWERWE